MQKRLSRSWCETWLGKLIKSIARDVAQYKSCDATPTKSLRLIEQGLEIFDGGIERGKFLHVFVWNR